MSDRRGPESGPESDQPAARPPDTVADEPPARPPDAGPARRWQAAVRRIVMVEIDVRPGGIACRAHGTRFRLPFSRRIPLRLALGLAEVGVPVVVHDHRPPRPAPPADEERQP